MLKDHCIYLITVNESYYYIGQSRHALDRRKIHLSELNRGIHFNKALQDQYNNSSNFDFKILDSWKVKIGYRYRDNDYAGKFMARCLEARFIHKYKQMGNVLNMQENKINDWRYLNFASIGGIIKIMVTEENLPEFKKSYYFKRLFDHSVIIH